ncbi:Methylated-DNA--protein-cysteine methyltransferase (6-O-methylguanine-DNA methyltransferase) (MGMT) (O-6-methylguanine-DNA-alkyltransferase) [Frankia canadensis]|uniref:methylated-DNA--[protein]-cysteine S-methyltransferase n=1 Tax=Frankia canadensis TaxID=1836972 RepID=A0A2I2L0Y9_9ACTN|nr:methylated-DNA--[protein]-cysteine S-methyltransferase [Frankia canadensis]SNQ51578.1 Methylated-DNA--protein-cysteine methyltransferase (6-O-methylguanine-DNA methyltransferase) (MGMT) (O-6-methylguanine-DNA-alkyltransferase) [Frankia canadensis]SOU58868.1 Methylated-DNA--protein-cysteine methyltransferase (6-O-methylguanine-DNA methyltransferase) (MGMT) (O-6-methylguanine-DNA-alkyltransferase) [Frankia canadensis]
MTLYTTMPSPLGELLLAGTDSGDGADGVALTSLSMTRQRGAVAPAAHWQRAREPFAEVVRQLDRYFAGELREFRLTLRSHGSPFQERVWRELEAIPYGTTISYGALAARMGAGRRDARAVGTAVGANPLLLIRPCHRVIGADGALRGFAAGLDRKEFLLRHEGARTPALERVPARPVPDAPPAVAWAARITRTRRTASRGTAVREAADRA